MTFGILTYTYKGFRFLDGLSSARLPLLVAGGPLWGDPPTAAEGQRCAVGAKGLGDAMMCLTRDSLQRDGGSVIGLEGQRGANY
jgi:hypothetical protein